MKIAERASKKSKPLIKNASKILFFKIGAIGDVLMTTPLLRSIKQKYPKSEITYLTGKWSSPVLANNPNISRIIEFEDSIFFKKRIFQLLKLILKIRREKFDLVFVLDKSQYVGLFAKLCKIPIRVGFDRSGEGKYNTLSVPYGGKKHEIEYYLDLAKLFSIKTSNKMELVITKNIEKKVANLLKSSKRKRIGFSVGGASNPGQVMAVKRWPLENYHELAKILSEKYDIVMIGGKSDEPLSQEVLRGIEHTFDFTGETSIAESAAVIKKCSLFITHDSGPMHIAVATKTQTIQLFGPTDYHRFGYNFKPHRVISAKGCAPCYDVYGNYKECKNNNCMKGIKPELVAKVAREMLK